MIYIDIFLWCMASHVWSFNNSYLSLMGCAMFGLYTPAWGWYRCPEIETSSIDWAQLSRFYLKTETESSLRNVLF
jgi:hypothetical protein